jgi:hypothetical protein
MRSQIAAISRLWSNQERQLLFPDHGRAFAIDRRLFTPLARSSAWQDSDPHGRQPYGHVTVPHHRCDNHDSRIPCSDSQGDARVQASRERF